MINGKKVYLRALERTDVARMQQWINDPDITPYLISHFPYSLDQEMAWYNSKQRPESKEVILGIVEKTTDIHVGNIGLHGIDWVNSVAEVGIFIGDKGYWSKGLGTDAMATMLSYAFGELNLNRIFLNVFKFNERAIRSYEKCGFVVEAVLRDDVFKNNRYHDTVVMGILRDEFDIRGR